VPLPTNFFDDDVNYRIRVCMLIEQDPLIGLYTGSVVSQCDRCGAPVWYDDQQVIPDVEDEVTGDVALCLDCARWCIEKAEAEDPGSTTWIEGHEPPGGNL